MPRLGIGWIPTNQGNSWALLVSLPKPRADVAFVRVEGNINSTTDMSRDSILARRGVWVKVKNQRYSVQAFSKSRQLLTGAVPSGETELLESRMMNLFHAGTAGGLHLTPDEPLIRGKTYFALTKRSSWSAPHPKLVKQVPAAAYCDPHREWIGHLVYFPVAINEGLNQ